MKRTTDLTGIRDQCLTSLLDMTEELGADNVASLINIGLMTLAGNAVAAKVLAFGAGEIFNALADRKDLEDELNS